MAVKRRWVLFAQIAASIVFLGLVAVVARPAELLRTVAKANTWLVALSLAFVPAIMILRISRWHLIARTRKADIPFRDSYDSYMGGLAISVVAPWVAELARGAFAAPTDKAGFVGLTFLDKLIDVTMLYVFACAGLAVLAPGGYKIVAAAAIIPAVCAWLAARPLVSLADRVLPRSKMAEALRRAVTASRDVSPGVLGAAFALAAVNVAVYYSQLYVIVYAFSPQIEAKAAGLFPLITLSRLVPSFGGLGVREFVAGALFARFNYSVTSAAAVDAAFVQFVFANVVPAAVWLMTSGMLARLAARRQGELVD